MADAGIGEAALLAAAAEASAAAAAAGGTAAAVLPEVLGTAAAAAGTTAAAAAPEIAAAAVPSLVLAAPEAAAIAAPEVIAPIAASATEVAAPAATVAATVPEATTPIFLGATEAQPIATGVLGTGATTGTEVAPTSGLLAQDIGFGAGNVAPGWAGETLPAGTGLPSTPAITTGEYAPGLLDKLGNWWQTSSLGDKLSVGGKALGGISAAQKVMAPTAGSSAGPKTTIKPGSTGKPQGGEQALAQVVESLLKRRDAYSGAPYGTPVAYRPRGLLG